MFCQEEAEAVTDELGMSEKAKPNSDLAGLCRSDLHQDRQEKEEWREKRKKEREAAIERMKMKVSSPDPVREFRSYAKSPNPSFPPGG